MDDRHRLGRTGRGVAPRPGPDLAVRQEGSDALDDVVVVEGPGGRDDQVGGPVPVGVERGDVVALHLLDRGLRAERLATQGMVGEHRLEQAGVDDVVGRVLVHEDLFEDHLALGVDLGRPEGGTGHDVGQQVEAEVELGHRQARVVRGVLTRR